MLSTLFSKNIHQQAMEQSLFAAVTINDKNQIIFFNAAAENLFGYTRQEVLGKNVDVLIPTALRAGHDDKTNLLSLNASIEAVRVLASQSGTSAKHIGQLAQEAQSCVAALSDSLQRLSQSQRGQER